MKTYYRYEIFNISTKFSPSWGAFQYDDAFFKQQNYSLNYHYVVVFTYIRTAINDLVINSVMRVLERHIGNAEDHIFRHKHIITLKQLEDAWGSL